MDSYRVDAEGFRDLHAIVRDRCADIVEAPVLQYHILRRDNLSYVTEDLDELLGERNGEETGLRSVNVEVKHPDDLSLRVGFQSQGLILEAESVDRARLSLLVSDIRALTRERMTGRGSSARQQLLRNSVPYFAVITLLLSYLFLIDTDGDQREQRYQRALESRQLALLDADNAMRARELGELEATRELAQVLLTSGTSEDKIDFLVNRAVDEAGPEQASTSLPFPEYEDRPNYLGIGYWMAAGVLVALLAYAMIYVAVPRSEHIFLIGAEVTKQAKRDKRRDQAVWGIAVAFAVGVASSIVVALIT